MIVFCCSSPGNRAFRIGWLLLAGGMIAAADRPAAPPPPPPLSAAVKQALNQISGKTVVEHAAQLSSPDMKGRAAGTHGAVMAAEYIEKDFRRIGLRQGGIAGTYCQTFKIRAGYQITSELAFTHTDHKPVTLHRKEDYMPIHIPQNASRVTGGVVLAGYGISSPGLKFDEYAGLDVKDQVVLVFGGVPWSAETAAWLWRLEKKSRDNIAYKAKTAAAAGAAMLLVVDDPSLWKRFGGAEELRLPDRQFPLDSTIPVVHISRRGAVELTGLSEGELRQLANTIRAQRQPQSQPLKDVKLDYQATIAGQAHIGRNVIAVLPGSDPVLRQEAVVIGAHFDHLGEGAAGTYFGANDNAAGVGAVLEIAAAFRGLPDPPARTIVFVAFGAEEIGKLGSNHYVAKPVVPIERTITMINFDMIGHNDPNEINVCATRSSSQLHRLHQEMNRYLGMDLVHPDNFRIGRSDHTAFYLAGVPVMYLFGGFHKEYNTPRDTAEKLSPEKLERVTRLAFLTAWAVANTKDKIEFDWNLDPDRK